MQYVCAVSFDYCMYCGRDAIYLDGQAVLCAACKVEHHCVTYRHALKQNIRQRGHYDVALTMHAGFFAV